MNTVKKPSEMYIKFEDMSMGTNPYGAKIHKEVELLPGVIYAIKESRQFRTYPRIKTVITWEVVRYVLISDEFGTNWEESSSYVCKNKSEANKVFKVSTNQIKDVV